MAHPRACGENLVLTVGLKPPVGSSPRMRGKRKSPVAWLSTGRLIPAHAGKTRRHSRASRKPRAHPRACGENIFTVSLPDRSRGSSPRMRGKRTVWELFPHLDGLIPAHAGKTIRPGVWAAKTRAHPRACGENVLTCSALALASGSSPRMRGKLKDSGSYTLSVGLIPAHAGKTARDASHA